MVVGKMKSNWSMDDLYKELKAIYGMDVEFIFPHEKRTESLSKKEYDRLFAEFKKLLDNKPHI